jgi:hypothetical protein
MQTRLISLGRIRIIPLAALGLGLLVGCAGRQQYEEGDRLITAGEQEHAVASLRQAVAADPGNPSYQMKLADAESAAAEAHVRSAESLIAGKRSAEARTDLQRALELMPAHPKALTLMAGLDGAAPSEPTVAQASPAVREQPDPTEAAQPQATPRMPPVAPPARARIQSAAPANTPAAAAVSATMAPPPAIAMHSAAAMHSASPPESPSAEPSAAVQPNRPTPMDVSPAAALPQHSNDLARRPTPAGQPIPQPAPALADPTMQPAEPTAQAAQPDEAPALAPLPPGGIQEPPAPAAVPAPPLPAGFRGVISRDDKHYPKELMTLDGIVVKVKDTSDRPPRADVEIRVEKTQKRYDNLRVGMRINGRGISRAPYRVVILAINPDTETVAFSIESLQEETPPAPPAAPSRMPNRPIPKRPASRR